MNEVVIQMSSLEGWFTIEDVDSAGIPPPFRQDEWVTANDWMIWVHNTCDIGGYAVRIRKCATQPSKDRPPPGFEGYKVCLLEVPPG